MVKRFHINRCLGFERFRVQPTDSDRYWIEPPLQFADLVPYHAHRYPPISTASPTPNHRSAGLRSSVEPQHMPTSRCGLMYTIAQRCQWAHRVSQGIRKIDRGLVTQSWSRHGSWRLRANACPVRCDDRWNSPSFLDRGKPRAAERIRPMAALSESEIPLVISIRWAPRWIFGRAGSSGAVSRTGRRARRRTASRRGAAWRR